MTEVICCNEFQGVHAWRGCPGDFPHSHLSATHRHVFTMETRFAVQDDDRQVEIFWMEDRIREFVRKSFRKVPGTGLLDFGGNSCEMIARMVVKRFKARSCEVREDGRGGAKVVAEC